MLKNIIVGLFICAVVLTAGRMLFAGTVGSDAGIDASLIINSQEVGNKICPVLGEEINEDSKATYEYKGKIYNFCCAACIEEFKKDPDKYIQIVDEELKNSK